jgi:aconitate hydratase
MLLFGGDRLQTKDKLLFNGSFFWFYSLKKAASSLGDISRLPYSLKILLENVLRFENGRNFSVADAQAIVDWTKKAHSDHEVSFQPARVLMQDFTGVPAVVDLAAMRDFLKKNGGDPSLINPLIPVDLVVDHSVMVDRYGDGSSFHANVDIEYERNIERYNFLKWGQGSLKGFRVVPPGMGICHQVNLECLAKVVFSSAQEDGNYLYPDTLVGTDSHTTMVNGLGVLGWGVGGIEAEAAMLGQPISMVIPDVVGFKIFGDLKEGITATDLVLTITNMLRKHGVVGKIVEFYGPGLDSLSLADRATISNMSPEFGSTAAVFPVDDETLRYLRLTGREDDLVSLVEAYTKTQGMWRDDSIEATYSSYLSLNLSDVEPSLAGPKRPQDRLTLSSVKSETQKFISPLSSRSNDKMPIDGDVVIAAITSCTNTSNPSVLVAAGLLAKKAWELGLSSKPWVKTSLAPGSKVVTDYLNKSGLDEYLNKLGFHLVGYGCTTCIGNSGPLNDDIALHVDENKLNVSAVLSGNRNFEGRVHPQVKLNYLASPPLVVAYAIAGTMNIDLSSESIGVSLSGEDVYLKDIWPTTEEINKVIESSLSKDLFIKRYSEVFDGDDHWQSLSAGSSTTYDWDKDSSYIQLPPYFNQNYKETNVCKINNARILGVFGDSITTDHISPAGNIRASSPAGAYLQKLGVSVKDFNSYGSRRGNHKIMMRGTFANIRLVNEMTPENPGGFTKYYPDESIVPIYDAAMSYMSSGVDTVVFAGKEYGSGSSRDWAAKGTKLLGVKAVIAESFERIHRSNLVGMGVLPLEFKSGDTRHSINIDGSEIISITGLSEGIRPKMDLDLRIKRSNGQEDVFSVLCRIDTLEEVEYFTRGGILPYVVEKIKNKA